VFSRHSGPKIHRLRLKCKKADASMESAVLQRGAREKMNLVTGSGLLALIDFIGDWPSSATNCS
jgi:hypothetical protein